MYLDSLFCRQILRVGLCRKVSNLYTIFAVTYWRFVVLSTSSCSSQRRIQNPVEHLQWSFFMKIVNDLKYQILGDLLL